MWRRQLGGCRSKVRSQHCSRQGQTRELNGSENQIRFGVSPRQPHRAGPSWRYDIAYVDGSHQAPDVLIDSVLAFKLLRVGGIMVFDDYLWHMEAAGKQDLVNMPKLAIDAFININIRKLNIIAGAPLGQIYIAKASD
ncbi:MAG: hypothetical protein DCF16_01505 [Alphaproteobacteria bacterium]|nr:MAG: hypothetical protein DCF16_01505 [Alphaproteobacteria bacterium]